MNKYDIAEESYKNGYDKGYRDGAECFANYLKDNSFWCEDHNGDGFRAIDVSCMEEFLHMFL